jgi:hypothetical protein
MSFLGDAWGAIKSPFTQNTKKPRLSGVGETYDPNQGNPAYITGEDASVTYDQLGARANAAGGRAAPVVDYSRAGQQLGYADASLGDARNVGVGQMQLASRLADVEAGRGGPSVAELSMRAAADDAQRRNLSMAAGGTGSSGAGGMIAAMNANAAQQGQLVRDVGVQRAAEIATARGQLGGVLTDARGQTIQGAQAAGQIADAYGRQTEFAAQNEQATRAQNDAARFQYDALAQDYAARESARRTGAEQFRVGAVQQDDALRSGQYSATLGAEAQRDAATVGMVGTGLAAGAMLAASDVRSKEKIAPADAVGALERVGTYAYNYRDPYGPGAEPGRQVGPMAQELAATPEGKTVVEKGRDGKLAVNAPRLSLLNASATGEIARRVSGIEAALAVPTEYPGAGAPRMAPRDAATADSIDRSVTATKSAMAAPTEYPTTAAPARGGFSGGIYRGDPYGPAPTVAASAAEPSFRDKIRGLAEGYLASRTPFSADQWRDAGRAR